nr:hypothetical protein CFP56_06204 [Quercus suber]
MRHNFAHWNKAKKKLVKAKLNLPVGLNVSKRLVWKNGLDVTVVMKKFRAKNKGWIEKRRAPLYNVERGYLLVEEGLNWQVASICLFSISLHRSLNMQATTVPIGDMDPLLRGYSCHLSLTESVSVGLNFYWSNVRRYC